MSLDLKGFGKYWRQCVLVLVLICVSLCVALIWRLRYTPEWRLMMSSDAGIRLQAAGEMRHKAAWRAKYCAPRIIRDSDPQVASAGLALIANKRFIGMGSDIRVVYQHAKSPMLKANAVETLATLRVDDLSEVIRDALNDDHLSDPNSSSTLFTSPPRSSTSTPSPE